MRILTTGATGLMGSELVLLFLQSISILLFNYFKKKIETNPTTRVFIESKAWYDLKNCLMGVDAIIHLMGSINF